MRSQKVVEHVEKVPDMLSIVARLAGADVIDNHVTDLFRAMLLVRQILSKRGRGHFGHMFVLGDGKHLFFGEAAKGHAILKGNHVDDHALLCGIKDAHERIGRSLMRIKPNRIFGKHMQPGCPSSGLLPGR